LLTDPNLTWDGSDLSVNGNSINCKLNVNISKDNDIDLVTTIINLKAYCNTDGVTYNWDSGSGSGSTYLAVTAGRHDVVVSKAGCVNDTAEIYIYDIPNFVSKYAAYLNAITSDTVITNNYFPIVNVPAIFDNDVTVNGILTVNGTSTSKYYQCRNGTYDGSQTTVIGTVGTYYTVNGLINDTSFNMSYTDSTITIPISGIYLIQFNSSSALNTNTEVVHYSLFVDDVEDMFFENEVGFQTSGTTYGNQVTGTAWFNGGEVLKVRVKVLSNTGTITHEHFYFDVMRMN